MINREAWSLQRRTLLGGFAALGASAIIGRSQVMAAVEQNILRSRGMESNQVCRALRYSAEETSGARGLG